MSRVLSLQEVFRAKKTIMCEFRWGIPPQRVQLREIVHWLKQKQGEYLHNFRCWDKKPTEQEMISTDWEKSKKERRYEQ